MLVITGLLTAAGLTACLNVTRDIPDVTARLVLPGGCDIRIIIDDDGYIELGFRADPGTTPSEITTTLTRAITVLTETMAERPRDGSLTQVAEKPDWATGAQMSPFGP